ncbi:LysR family transcriptional regulator [Microvirga sp. W0021]|uniref:LysR family transcriptional regulator n=1 Tax=Hohaiivirga grylli TaxID=3133970 RepID=A0ABV0BIX6_9HYPH
MDIQKLKYFRAVAQTEHISKAAQKLHIAQPALSKAITMMEEELGTPLFIRTGRRIRINEYGLEFLKYAEAAISAFENGRNALNRMGQKISPKIRLQTNIINDHYLIGLMKSFKEKHPDVRFVVIKNYIKSKFLYDCDLYIHAAQINLHKCESVPLFSEKIMLGVPENHPLARNGGVELHQIANEQFISLDDTTSWVEETEAFCEQAGFTPTYSYQCDGTDMIAKLINAGEGIGFLPEKSWGDFPSGVRLLNIRFPICNRNYNMSWQTGKPQSEIVSAFRDHTLRYYSSHQPDH